MAAALPVDQQLAVVHVQRLESELVGVPSLGAGQIGSCERRPEPHFRRWLTWLIGLLDHPDPVAVTVAEPGIANDAALRIGGARDPVDRPVVSPEIELLEREAPA